MMQTTDERQVYKESLQTLEASWARWRERYEAYQCLLAEFRVRQQDFDFLLIAWMQELYGGTPVGFYHTEQGIARRRTNPYL